MSKTADYYTELTTMQAKGYRYYCQPVDSEQAPYIGLYAKDLAMVAMIHRDWPKQMFTVVEIEKVLDGLTEQAYDDAYNKQNW